ncbi:MULTISPECIES: hypothetical protein [Vibrio]|uniref:hypothetical protein n=1 Tax=Vibrio TaxID=662 RepID=UPI0005ABFFD7|nr:MULTISPECIES: hypothetical protein [Vibrio]EHA1204515.1 ADP-ribosyl-(dinitrogen reductase) hydrolase [Vibrio alginolyticus]EJU9971679.1 hypothetical protein [Vibrio alginolyticus]ELA8260356.1 hypothetical protein [Vibrio alginolyticus]ELB2767595.1 hypothetical protein [Vibrio alginolyticus]KIP66829.1 ADP-ribosyl-(dinitrogen reductase) hydrolase [Vibrio alginolyticus]
MCLVISTEVRKKLRTKHDVIEQEIVECFANREAGFLKDIREQHQSDPPTLWFVAETDYGRKLKVVFIYFPDTNKFVIRTAYPANPTEISIYEKHS